MTALQPMVVGDYRAAAGGGRWGPVPLHIIARDGGGGVGIVAPRAARGVACAPL
jgi:hypothetical protein